MNAEQELKDLRTLEDIVGRHSFNMQPHDQQFLVAYFSTSDIFANMLRSSNSGEVRQLVRVLVPELRISYPKGGYFNPNIHKDQILVPLRPVPGYYINFQITVSRTFLRKSLSIFRKSLTKIKQLLLKIVPANYGYQYSLRTDFSTVFKQGDPFNGLFIIFEGKVTYSRDRVTFIELLQGSLFGELELRGEPRLFTAQAALQSKIIWLPVTAVEFIKRSENFDLQKILQKKEAFFSLVQQAKQSAQKIYSHQEQQKVDLQVVRQFSQWTVVPYGVKVVRNETGLQPPEPMFELIVDKIPKQAGLIQKVQYNIRKAKKSKVADIQRQSKLNHVFQMKRRSLSQRLPPLIKRSSSIPEFPQKLLQKYRDHLIL